MTEIGNEEAPDTKKIFYRLLREERMWIPVLILAVNSILIPVIFSIFLSLTKQDNFFVAIFAPLMMFTIPFCFGLFLLYLIHLKAVREAFWIQISLKYNWQYSPLKNVINEKALLFNKGHSKEARHEIKGDYKGQPFSIFEYGYVVGSGKYRKVYLLTVFEIKFTGTFPHIYLNNKDDGYSNVPSFLTSYAKISVPSEFENKFKLYSPKEYEIETLEIFTPNIFSLLLDSEWDHDMEFIDGELVIYRKIRFHNFEQLDSELTKIKKFIDIFSPVLNRLKLTQIGDINPYLRK